MLSSSAVDRVSGIQTANHDETHRLRVLRACGKPPGGVAAGHMRARLGEADVQVEVSEPQMQHSAAGPVHDVCQQDDDQDHDHQPEEEHDLGQPNLATGGNRELARRSAGCGKPPAGVRLATCITCERLLGKADVQVEVSEPQMQDSAAGPVHDVCQQDDDQDHDHQPEEEHDDPGDDVPSYSSRSSHGLQLPGAARIIRTPRAGASDGGKGPRHHSGQAN